MGYLYAIVIRRLERLRSNCETAVSGQIVIVLATGWIDPGRYWTSLRPQDWMFLQM